MDFHGLTPEMLLQAYAAGVFPMAERKEDPEVFWVDPRRRGIMPLDGFHISHSLARRLRRGEYRVTFDKAFVDVLDGCADRPETWINVTIRALSIALHGAGDAHSVEVWDGRYLAGGVYGVALGQAFFGESMFSRRTDASKVALAYLVDRLRTQGFRLFDTQFITPHLESLGAIEISREEYRNRLADALTDVSEFPGKAEPSPGQELLQRMTHTS